MVKKKSVKKSKTKTAKKARRVEVTIKTTILGEVPEEHHFVLQGGERIKSLQELADAMETMSEEVFSFHVNEARNDFATWAKDIFRDSGLAKEMESTQNRIETRIKLLQRLVDEVIKEGKKKK